MENGYIVWSLAVSAFIKVAMDRLSILKNGSRSGYVWDPQRTVCSRMWGAPLLLSGTVLKMTLRPGADHEREGERERGGEVRRAGGLN